MVEVPSFLSCTLNAEFAVTGASGYIASHLVRFLARRGHAVLALSREGSRQLPENVIVRSTSQFRTDTDWENVFSGIRYVIHLAGLAHQPSGGNGHTSFDAINHKLAVQVAKGALLAGVERFVFVSSIGVHGSQSLDPITELSPFAPKEPYALSKLAAESSLRILFGQDVSRMTVIRPAMVYGPDCPGNLPRLIRLCHAGWPLPFAGLTNMRSMVWIDSLVDLLYRSATNSQKNSGCFVAADAQPISMSSTLAAIGDGLGEPLRMFSLPQAILQASATITGRRLEWSKLANRLIIDSSNAVATMGWNNNVDVSEKIALVARHWMAARARERQE